MGVYGIHPYVLLNFENSKRDVSTIAHELGHAIHSYYSDNNQSIINSNYTIMVAEVASTVNEILLSEYQIENENNKEKKKELLYELLEMIRATFFRQSMFAEFEKVIHEKVGKGISLSAEDLNKIYYDLNKKYFGDSIVIDEEIQYEWARIPHFYSNFYVYKYATGFSAASALSKQILEEGDSAVDRYKEFLKSGGSEFPLDQLRKAGVDMEKKEAVDEALHVFKDLVKQLEKEL